MATKTYALEPRRFLCSNCHEPELLRWAETINRRLEESGECHECHYWLSDPPHVIVDGYGWAVDLEHAARRAYGGRTFRVRFVESNITFSSGNLRFRGRRPASLGNNSAYADNAVFLGPAPPVPEL